MDWEIKHHRVAASLMIAVTALNIALAVNFLSASGRALAAAFTGQTIFLLAGIELIVVLCAYVVTRHRPSAVLRGTRARAG